MISENKYFRDRVLDYPVQTISWADLKGGPTIAEARGKTSLSLLARIDHLKFPYVSAKVVKEQVKAAISLPGNTKFILAPGCSRPPYSFTPLNKAACAAVRE